MEYGFWGFQIGDHLEWGVGEEEEEVMVMAQMMQVVEEDVAAGVVAGLVGPPEVPTCFFLCNNDYD